MRTHRKPDLLFLLAAFVGIGVAISSYIQHLYTRPAIDESTYSSATAEGSYREADGSYSGADGSYRNVADAASPAPNGQLAEQFLEQNQLIQVSSDAQTLGIELNQGLVNSSQHRP
ncbi:MAG: hypothetical protein PVJ39_07005 [Gammaproteobacteria bacterium]|jgi:hypothetical protein